MLLILKIHTNFVQKQGEKKIQTNEIYQIKYII